MTSADKHPAFERPWRLVERQGEVDDDIDEGAPEDHEYAAKIGLPGKRAWAQYITDGKDQGGEIALDSEYIGFLGGFPLEMEDEDRPVGTASVWMPEDDADVRTLVSDLLREGISKEHGPGLIDALCRRISDPTVLMLVSRDVNSRRATALLVYHRDVTVSEGEVSYNVFPEFFHGTSSSLARYGLMACFQAQTVADIETIVTAMVKADDIRPFSSTCHSLRDEFDELAEEMVEIIDFAQDASFDGEDLPEAFDFERIAMERASGFSS